MTNKRVAKKKVVKSLYWMCEDGCTHYDECSRPGDARVCVYARKARKAAHVKRAASMRNKRRK
jgi:hypothetical protein